MCFLSSAAEYDDQEGPVRDALVMWFEALQQGLERTWAIAVEERHLAYGDLPQLVSEMHGIVMKFHLDLRLLQSARAYANARTAFARLLDGVVREGLA